MGRRSAAASPGGGRRYLGTAPPAPGVPRNRACGCRHLPARAQGVWPEAAPYLDAKALQGAERLDLPKDPERLTELAGDTDPAVLAAALVRAAVDKEAAEDTLRRAG